MDYADPESVRYGTPHCRNCDRHIEWNEDEKAWYHTATGKLVCD